MTTFLFIFLSMTLKQIDFSIIDVLLYSLFRIFISYFLFLFLFRYIKLLSEVLGVLGKSKILWHDRFVKLKSGVNESGIIEYFKEKEVLFYFIFTLIIY